MLEKYRATIQGNTVIWDGEEPAAIDQGRQLKVEITVVSDNGGLPVPDGDRMANALERLASLPSDIGLRSITDPVEWQRESRKDRTLPGR